MGAVYSNHVSENKRDYAVGCGNPSVHSRFKNGESGNPCGPRPKDLPALLIEALDERSPRRSTASAARSPSARRS
jgi:hypothetical protein